MLFSNNEGHEFSICTPYPALKLSPKTTIVLAVESILFEEFTGTISVSKIAKFTKRQTLKDLILEVKNITKEVNSPEGALTIVQDETKLRLEQYNTKLRQHISRLQQCSTTRFDVNNRLGRVREMTDPTICSSHFSTR